MSNVSYLYCELPGFIRKPIWKILHTIITSKDVGKEVVFMNYGYAYDGGAASPPKLHARDEGDRYCIQLYDLVGGKPADITGKRVLEVGCGRGGGASYLTRYFEPESYRGVDISHNVVGFCKKCHTVDNLSFLRGEAEDLPIDDESVDTVVNVESSRCYRDKDRFFREVNRVLKPRGTLLFADMREPREVELLEEHLRKNGFTITEKEDITSGVVRALGEDHTRRIEMMSRLTPWFLRRAVPDFAGVVDSKRYTSFVDGSMLYLRYRAEKLG
jgi:ubiquinone/menaquinone biosynthesis C-methylase UbiE